MKLPQRVPQHISETSSFKIFSFYIPDNWIIRDITERDYGIDCYLEFVNDENELSGELALIQLKSRQSIEWTSNDYYTLSGIDIATSNYWYKFPVPVFIFLVDISQRELFFISVDSFIKKNFGEYIKQKTFSYRISKTDKFQGRDGITSLKRQYHYEYYRKQFENELLFFLSNLQYFKDFQEEHDNRDYHLGIEEVDLIYFEAMHRNYQFLCNYLDIENPIPTLSELKMKSSEKFKDSYYELYEHDLTGVMPKYRELTLLLTAEIKVHLEKEESYWIESNPTVYNYVDRIRDNGELPGY